MKTNRSTVSLSVPVIVSTAIVLAAGLAPAAAAAPAVSAEKGRDVGSGVVLYDCPYDPATVADVTFVAPTPAYPRYEIALPLGDWTEGTNAAVNKVTVNGHEMRACYVFVDGEARPHSDWITHSVQEAQQVVVVARAPWSNGAAVSAEVTIGYTDLDGKADTMVRTFTATAPELGGVPAGWHRYQSVALEETAGIDRVAEPVEFSFTTRVEDCGDLERELRVYGVDPATGTLSPTACQLFDVQAFPGTPPGTSNDDYLYHPTRSANVVFLADVPADSVKVYVVLYDNPDAPAPEPAVTDLTVAGPPLGALVENAFYKVKLHDECGQISAMDLKGRPDDPAPTLTNSYSRAVHWNPDSYTDNGKWGHTFSWDPPEKTIVSANGPILFRVTNSGRMPGYTPQIWASVTYSFYASTPYVKCTTITEVRDPINASAIRNGEIVLDAHLVTHWVWQEHSGDVRFVRGIHGPVHEDEWAHRVDHDVPWIAMTNELDDYGVGTIVTESTAFNPNCGEATTHRPAFYLYAHPHWGIPLTYFTRGWVYPFSDYQRGPIRPVQVGSTYLDKMAFMPFFLHESDDRYKDIIDASGALHHPLRQRWGK